MAKMLTVTVTDATGAVLFQYQVDVTSTVGTNGDAAGLTDVEKALLVTAPEVCPFDCSQCRE